MRLSLQRFAFAAVTLPFVYPPHVLTEAPAPGNSLPVQHLLDSANQLLAQGNMWGALDKLDAAIKKDPQDYLTFFKRGATYLSLGRLSQASVDFDTVLALRPGFDAALLQRAKIKTKTGDWGAARKDYKAVGSKTEELKELDDAEKAMREAEKAEKKKHWDACVENSGIVLQLAPQLVALREMRARCRLARGDTLEAIRDLQQVATLNPALTDPYIHIATLYFFAVGEPENAREQLRHCLTYDQENKACKRQLRKIRTVAKAMDKVKAFQEKRQFTSAVKILSGSGEDKGLIEEVRSGIKSAKEDGLLIDAAGVGLLVKLLSMTCESYVEMNNHRLAASSCDEVLKHSPHALYAVLNKGQRLIDEELYDQAISLLEKAHERHTQDQRLSNLIREARILLRRSKQKDYYKVLGIKRDATDKEIKKAYRKLAKEWHPDTYVGDLGKDEVEKKYSTVSEAYEVLGNEELRARFDRGDDPNDQTQQNPFAQGGHQFHHGGGQQFYFKHEGRPGGFPFGDGFKFNF